MVVRDGVISIATHFHQSLISNICEKFEITTKVDDAVGPSGVENKAESPRYMVVRDGVISIATHFHQSLISNICEKFEITTKVDDAVGPSSVENATGVTGVYSSMGGKARLER
jgi:hypothetical protein